MTGCVPPPRPQADRDLGHHGLVKVCHVLRQCPRVHHPRPHLPRGRAVRQEPPGGLRGRGGQTGLAGPPRRHVRYTGLKIGDI